MLNVDKKQMVDAHAQKYRASAKFKFENSLDLVDSYHLFINGFFRADNVIGYSVLYILS